MSLFPLIFFRSCFASSQSSKKYSSYRWPPKAAIDPFVRSRRTCVNLRPDAPGGDDEEAAEPMRDSAAKSTSVRSRMVTTTEEVGFEALSFAETASQGLRPMVLMNGVLPSPLQFWFVWLYVMKGFTSWSSKSPMPPGATEAPRPAAWWGRGVREAELGLSMPPAATLLLAAPALPAPPAKTP